LSNFWANAYTYWSMIHSVEQEELRHGPERAAGSALIKSLALELGFHKVGIVRAETLIEEGLRLQQWLARGFHGEMKWMEREPSQRADPLKLFPDAKSVIVVAVNYYTAHPGYAVVPTADLRRGKEARAVGTTAYPGTGKVSRYAWGDDYHEIVGEKLRRLLSLIKERWPDAEGKVCVDIQPTMDKTWAVRAGLGWMGKHTNIITEDYGSWIFIGELLLNLELAYDESEVADQCGSCTLCLDACPTSAIVEPYVLDSNLCISHATIESRAPEMRADVAAHSDGWLYGCDVCQDVCPWNAMTPVTDEPRFEPRAGNVNASLSEILELTPETYAARFRGSAMKRAKLAGLQRNAKTLLNQTPV
jgi:epoxyqueuosine reductase